MSLLNMFPFIFLFFNDYLFSVCYVPGTAVATNTKTAALNKTGKSLCTHGVASVLVTGDSNEGNKRNVQSVKGA